MKRLPYLRIAVESLAAGAASALFVNAVWLTVTGGYPSPLTTLLLSEAVTAAWSIGQAARFRRKWQSVLASYDLPALGEGIDTPHRPPLNDGEGDR